MGNTSRKALGAYYTPQAVVESLLRLAVQQRAERLLDPACGDGRFIAGHPHSTGVEQDPVAAAQARARAPHATVHQGDFFAWSSVTHERFDCAAGNPPFIRYQTFKGQTRDRALALCRKLGARFTGLTSSWAPFLVAAAGMLKPGGRMALVVPAEIGHAPYSAPLLEYLVHHFGLVQLIAYREKLFPDLSEDCWILYAGDFGSSTPIIRFTALPRFRPLSHLPEQFVPVSVAEWRQDWNRRLRPFLLPASARELYRRICDHPESYRLGQLAAVGIGYVSGANEFFHLRPSAALRLGIPERLLQTTVRNGRALPQDRLTVETVRRWRQADEPVLLLRLARNAVLPPGVRRYLTSDSAMAARQAYKCRTREPWYSVPDVQVPDFFLTYMSGREPGLVRNLARCTGTNSVHVVRLRRPGSIRKLQAAWRTPGVKLSCEIEGHPLGGGMLKLEPREASQIVLPVKNALREVDESVVLEALQTLREWRHRIGEEEE